MSTTTAFADALTAAADVIANLSTSDGTAYAFAVACGL